MNPLRKGSVRGTVYLTQYETDVQRRAREGHTAASAAWKRGDVEVASQLWHEVVRIDPEHAGARAGLADFAEWSEGERRRREEAQQREAEERARQQQVLVGLLRSGAFTPRDYALATGVLGKGRGPSGSVQAEQYDLLQYLVAGDINADQYVQSVAALAAAPVQPTGAQHASHAASVGVASEPGAGGDVPDHPGRGRTPPAPAAPPTPHGNKPVDSSERVAADGDFTSPPSAATSSAAARAPAPAVSARATAIKRRLIAAAVGALALLYAARGYVQREFYRWQLRPLAGRLQPAPPSATALRAQLGVLDSVRTALAEANSTADSTPRAIVTAELYWDAATSLLVAPAWSAIVRTLRELPTESDAVVDHDAVYDALRAYLAVGDSARRVEPEILADALMSAWSRDWRPDPLGSALARRQFAYYAEHFEDVRPAPARPPVDTVLEASARAFVNKFPVEHGAYRHMLAAAGEQQPWIYLEDSVPGKAWAFVNPHVVPGAYTKQGWVEMQWLISNSNVDQKFRQGELWVVGERSPATMDDSTFRQQLRARFTREYTAHWRDFIASGHVVAPAGREPRATAQLLGVLVGGSSPIRATLGLVATNTRMDEVAPAFQVVHMLIPGNGSRRADGLTYDEYERALNRMLSQLNASSPGGGIAGRGADSAVADGRRTVGRLTQRFERDTVVHGLLNEPFAAAESALRPAGKGQAH